MQTKQPLKVATRLSFGFGGLLLLMIGLTLIGIERVQRINQTLTEMTEVNSVKQRYAINFRGSVHDRAISLRDVTLVPQPHDIPALLQEIEQLADFYQTSRRLMATMFSERTDISATERQLLQAIDAVEAKTLPLANQVIQLRQQGQQLQSQQILLAEAGPAFVDWLASINAFIDYQEAKNQQATNIAQSVAGGFALTMVLLTLLAIGIGIGMVLWILRYLQQALGGEPQQAASLVSQIAAGDLTTPIQHSTWQHAGCRSPHAATTAAHLGRSC